MLGVKSESKGQKLKGAMRKLGRVFKNYKNADNKLKIVL